MFTNDDLASLGDAELHEWFDLPDGSWAPNLLRDIAQQADERGIPAEAVPHLAANLDRLDYDRLMVDLAGAAELMGLHAGTVAAYARDKQGFWLPTVQIFDSEGNAKVKLWIVRKLEVLDKRRRSTGDQRIIGWRARKRREGQG